MSKPQTQACLEKAAEGKVWGSGCFVSEFSSWPRMGSSGVKQHSLDSSAGYSTASQRDLLSKGRSLSFHFTCLSSYSLGSRLPPKMPTTVSFCLHISLSSLYIPRMDPGQNFLLPNESPACFASLSRWEMFLAQSLHCGSCKLVSYAHALVEA